MDSLIFNNCLNVSLTANVTRYVPVCTFDYNPNNTTTEANAQEIISGSGTMSDLFVELTTAPGVGNTVTITLMLNGVASALTCTVSGTATTASDTTNTVTVSAGDKISYKWVTSAANSAARLRITSKYTGDTANESQIMGKCEALGSGDKYTYPMGRSESAVSTTDAVARQLCPTAGTLRDFYGEMTAGGAPGVGQSRTFELWKNNAATGVTFTISGTNTTGNDTTNTVSISPGDYLSIKCTSSASPTNAGFLWGFTFVATNNNEFPVLSGTSSDPDTAAAGYGAIFLQNINGVYGSDAQFSCGQTAYALALYAGCTTAPGSGASWSVAFRINSADTALVASITGTNTSGSDTETVSIADFDNVSIGVTPASTPAAPTNFYWGVNMSLVAPSAGGFEPVTSWFL